MVYIRGQHALKFGFFFEDFRKNEQFGLETQGIMDFFNGTPISTGNALVVLFISIAICDFTSEVVNATLFA